MTNSIISFFKRHFYLFTFFVLNSLVCCHSNSVEQKSSYLDYKYEKDLITIFNIEGDCGKKDSLYTLFKTIDFDNILIRTLNYSCGIEASSKIKLVNDNQLLGKLNDILISDQSAREELSDIFSDKSKSTIDVVDYYYRNVAKVDSINAIKLGTIIDSLGEWPGANYIERVPGMPKLEVLIGHFPEKYFLKYTKMAYKAATENKEYWSRVFTMITYSGTRPIEDKYINDSIMVVPFRFVEITSKDLIDENSDISILEFDVLSNSQTVFMSNSNRINPNYIISSSINDRNQRIKLINQAKKILVDLGMEENRISSDYEKQDENEGYKLFYQLTR